MPRDGQLLPKGEVLRNEAGSQSDGGAKGHCLAGLATRRIVLGVPRASWHESKVQAPQNRERALSGAGAGECRGSALRAQEVHLLPA